MYDERQRSGFILLRVDIQISQYTLLKRLISLSPQCILGSVAKDQCGLCSTGHCVCFYGYGNFVVCFNVM